MYDRPPTYSMCFLFYLHITLLPLPRLAVIGDACWWCSRLTKTAAAPLVTFCSRATVVSSLHAKPSTRPLLLGMAPSHAVRAIALSRLASASRQTELPRLA